MLTNDIGENITAYMFYLHTDYKKNRQNLAFLKSKLQCINHCRSSNESNGIEAIANNTVDRQNEASV